MKENKTQETKPSKNKTSKAGIHDGHRERMRKRFKQTGFDVMQEHEMLEMLLYYSIPRINTNEFAHKLIGHFGSLANVFEADYEELLKVEGIGENSAFLIKMMLPLFNAYSKSPDKKKSTVRFEGSNDCGKYLCKYYSCITTEIVVVLCVDPKGKLLALEKISEGDAASCYVNLRKIVETVLKTPQTAGIIIAHNHPKGVALPSREDITATTEIIKMLNSVNIRLIDHIIVAPDGFTSMLSSGGFSDVFKQNISF